MTRICEKLYPKGTYPNQREAGYYMDEKLKRQLDVLCKNIVHDWDFTIIISGKGRVRVGKSVLAMQIGQYLSYQMNEVYGKNTIWTLKDNFVWHGKDLIRQGHFLGKNHRYSAVIYDEAGADLVARKVMHASTQKVMDYFRECGQYNLFNILVIPDFFDLPKSIALSRSIFLIDVDYVVTSEQMFKKGYLKFYSEQRKKRMYLLGYKERNYNVVKPNFDGYYYDVYTVDKKKYQDLKKKAILSRDLDIIADKKELQRNAGWYYRNKILGETQKAIGESYKPLIGRELPDTTISDGIGAYKKWAVQNNFAEGKDFV